MPCGRAICRDAWHAHLGSFVPCISLPYRKRGIAQDVAGCGAIPEKHPERAPLYSRQAGRAVSAGRPTLTLRRAAVADQSVALQSGQADHALQVAGAGLAASVWEGWAANHQQTDQSQLV